MHGIENLIMSENEIKNEAYENVVKIGTFQLQTKSFWFGVIAMLSVFLLAVIWLNTFYWYKVSKDLIETNKLLIQKINHYPVTESK